MFFFQDDFACDFCLYKCTDFAKFARHLRRHEKESSFVLHCNHCPRKYTSLRYWRQHVLAHRPILAAPSTSKSPEALDHDVVSSEENASSGLPLEKTCLEDKSNNDADRLNKKTSAWQRDVASLLVRLRSEHGLKESGCTEVSDFLQNFSQQVAEESRDWGDQPIESLPAIVACSSLRTTYRVNKFFSKSVEVVKPITVKLGVNRSGVQQSFQYIPLLEQLSLLLNKHALLREEALKPARYSDGGEPSSYENWQTGHIHTGTKGLTIFIYYDDVQVVNPVGNKTRHNKLGVFYFSLGVVPFRSRKRHIFLLGLLRSSYLKEYRSSILGTIYKDCKTLEDIGISVECAGQVVSVKGSVALFIADNLAIHAVGGLLESFSNVSKVSRYCHCSSADIQNRLTFRSCTLRTAEEFDATVAELEQSGFNRALCLKRGISSKCALNSLSGFHIVENAPPDIAHDLYEGLIPLVTSVVLTELVKDRFLTLDDINRALSNFPYLRDDRQNPPQPLTYRQGAIRCNQTAKEALNLVRCLPLAVGYLIPKGNTAWIILLKFLTVIRFIISPRFLEGDLARLQDLIEDWIGTFFAKYPHRRVTPKFHYLLHYPNQIRKHGALINLTTLRYESKNGQLKTFAKTTKNFRNICKTVASKHQQWMSTRINQQDFFSWKFDYELEPSCGSNDRNMTKRVTIKGTEYVSGDIVAFHHGDAIQLGQIVGTICSEDHDFKFYCTKMTINEYDAHVAAYVVKETQEYVTVEHKNLADNHPLHLYGGRFVVEHHLLQTTALRPLA